MPRPGARYDDRALVRRSDSPWPSWPPSACCWSSASDSWPARCARASCRSSSTSIAPTRARSSTRRPRATDERASAGRGPEDRRVGRGAPVDRGRRADRRAWRGRRGREHSRSSGGPRTGPSAEVARGAPAYRGAEREARGSGGSLEYAVPLRFGGRRYALEVDQRREILGDRLAQLDRQMMIAGLGALPLGLIVFFLLGGRGLILHHGRAIEQSVRDGLTGLGNHSAFQDGVAREIASARRYREPLALAIVDIDDFKFCNDKLGHQHGDRVLQGVGAALADGRATDACFRVGGDEFAVLLPRTDLAGARLALEAAAARANSAVLGVQLSVGIAMLDAASGGPRSHARTGRRGGLRGQAVIGHRDRGLRRHRLDGVGVAPGQGRRASAGSSRTSAWTSPSSRSGTSIATRSSATRPWPGRRRSTGSTGPARRSSSPSGPGSPTSSARPRATARSSTPGGCPRRRCCSSTSRPRRSSTTCSAARASSTPCAPPACEPERDRARAHRARDHPPAPGRPRDLAAAGAGLQDRPRRRGRRQRGTRAAVQRRGRLRQARPLDRGQRRPRPLGPGRARGDHRLRAPDRGLRDRRGDRGRRAARAGTPSVLPVRRRFLGGVRGGQGYLLGRPAPGFQPAAVSAAGS